MFSIGRPSEKELREFLKSQRDEPFSYEEVGSSRDGAREVEGYVVDHNRVRIGAGEEAFARAVEALRGWRMFDLGWVRLCWPDAPLEVGTTVAVLGGHYSFWALNACRIVYRIEEDAGVRRFGFAYGTLPEHAASGEERFVVEWDRDEGSVWYDLYTYLETGQRPDEDRTSPCPRTAAALRPRLYAGYGAGRSASITTIASRNYLREALMIKLLTEGELTSVYTPGWPGAPHPAPKLGIPIW
ncbi:MAG TPA: DUF1990 domain-containing protein [Rubrobacteraceae bacterium]|nr:DUF1990 domain-containing protein [Rubrobacteraceae bacterium]